MKVEWQMVSHHGDLIGAEPVTQMMGNGLRIITPKQVSVTVYPNGNRYVMLRGPQIKRDGTVGVYRTVGWSIGGSWDESADAPDLVHQLLAALAEAVDRG